MSALLGENAMMWFIIWVLACVLALAFTVERTRFGTYLPAPVVLIFLVSAFSNFGVLPSQSPVYGELVAIAVPVGVSLLLLRADLITIIRSTGAMLPVFVLVSVCAIVACSLAILAFNFDDNAGVLGATISLFIGSVVNAVATSQAVEMDETFFLGVIAGNTLIAPAYLALAIFLSRSEAVGRFLRAEPGKSIGRFGHLQNAEKQEAPESDGLPAGLPPAAAFLMTLIYGIGLFLAAQVIATLLGIEQLSILVTITLAIAIPNLFPRLKHYFVGDRPLGMSLMLLFIAALAVQLDLTDIGYTSLLITGYFSTAIAINFVLMMVLGRLFRIDPHMLFLAAQAGVGGPTSTAALAAAQGREDLLTPGILCAMFGVTVSTFIGVAVYGLLA